MAQNIWDGDVHIRGVLQADAFDAPNDSVGNSAFRISEPLTAEKQIHQYTKNYKQDRGAAVANATGVPVHQAIAGGSVVEFRAALAVANLGGATVTIDLKKNGVSILNATFTLDSTTAAYVAKIASVNPASVNYVAGDFFEVSVVAAVGGGTIGQGLITTLTVREQAQ